MRANTVSSNGCTKFVAGDEWLVSDAAVVRRLGHPSIVAKEDDFALGSQPLPTEHRVGAAQRQWIR